MSEKESLQGLNCPNCGGVVPIPEGQVIVHCPYCDMRSFVKGDKGLRRFQLTPRVDRQNAGKAMQQFLSRNLAIARDANRQSQLKEAFLAYLPFWVVWGRAMGWAFGEEKVGSGDHSHYEPREVKIVEEMTWDGPACDVGEFGVAHVPITTQSLEPFNSDTLHHNGLVFEPVGSFSDAQASAKAEFEHTTRRRANLDRISQLFVRFFRQRFGMVYYPLWVLRYLYRGRSFQVVVDGYSGKVLYGKAPGNVLYRAAVLVLGMAAGAFLAIDGSTFFLSQMNGSDDSKGPLAIAAILFIVGIGLILGAYRAFRYGEQFEYRSSEAKAQVSAPSSGGILSGVEEVAKWVDRLS